MSEHEISNSSVASHIELAPSKPPRFLEPEFEIEHRKDGSCLVRSIIDIVPRYAHLPDLLTVRAGQFPHRTILAQRDQENGWRRISYSEIEDLSNRAASYLLNQGYGSETPMLILSGNSIEHAVMMLAAMKARIPMAPITVAYSTMDNQFTKLHQVFEIIQPVLIFADDTQVFRPALDAICNDETVVIGCGSPVGQQGFMVYEKLIASEVSPKLKASLDAISDDTVAKYMFTSGSTGSPKAVVHTHGMLRAQIASVDAIRQTHGDVEACPISLQWMPWSHVSSGNMSFHENLLEAGSLYIDDGRPVKGAFSKTLRNLREISPTLYGCAPIAYAWLVDALERDKELRRSFFKNLQSMIYGGAALPRSVYDRIQALAVKETGYRIPFMSVYGSTEASAVTLTYRENLASGMIGLPAPGVEIKLVPVAGKREVRVKGTSVFREYQGQPDLTAASFDSEGYFRMGDAASFLDEKDPYQGLVFDGRISEDFKLTSGTWVGTGNVRQGLLAFTQKLFHDIVICGENKPYLAVMAWLNVAAVRELAALSHPADAATDKGLSDADFLESPFVVQAVKTAFAEYNSENPASSTRIRRLLLLTTPPSIAQLETNEKGYINQRAVQDARKDELDILYQDVPSKRVVLLD